MSGNERARQSDNNSLARRNNPPGRQDNSLARQSDDNNRRGKIIGNFLDLIEAGVDDVSILAAAGDTIDWSRNDGSYFVEETNMYFGFDGALYRQILADPRPGQRHGLMMYLANKYMTYRHPKAVNESVIYTFIYSMDTVAIDTIATWLVSNGVHRWTNCSLWPRECIPSLLALSNSIDVYEGRRALDNIDPLFFAEFMAATNGRLSPREVYLYTAINGGNVQGVYSRGFTIGRDDAHLIVKGLASSSVYVGHRLNISVPMNEPPENLDGIFVLGKWLPKNTWIDIAPHGDVCLGVIARKLQRDRAHYIMRLREAFRNGSLSDVSISVIGEGVTI